MEWRFRKRFEHDRLMRTEANRLSYDSTLALMVGVVVFFFF